MTLHPEHEPLRQIEVAGYLQYLSEIDLERRPGTVYAKCDPVLVSLLRGDTERFQIPIPSPLHEDLGPNRVDFRAYKGELPGCRGSLHVIVSRCGPPPWNFYADVDGYNVQDVVNAIAHWGEVIKGWFS